ncbi:MAG: hypothetical protein Q3976_01425 [Corynebacterium sp.]|nr:hypothetical protein [Corynebacterium sp.]
MRSFVADVGVVRQGMRCGLLGLLVLIGLIGLQGWRKQVAWEG